MEEAVGEGATEALVEEQEQERDLHAFVCEPVGITAAIALEKGMTFQLAEVVAELIQAVGVGGKLEHGEYGLMDLLGGTTAIRMTGFLATAAFIVFPVGPKILLSKNSNNSSQCKEKVTEGKLRE